MSFIQNTAFEARVTNDRFDDLCNITGKYQASSADADCSAGLLCVRTTRIPNEGFTGIENENAWVMNAAAATATIDDVIYACDTHESQKLMGYHVGHRTLGLGVDAGELGVFKKIDFTGDKIYRFGVGNFSTAISTNKFATIANGLLVPAASAPTDAGSLYFKILGTGNFVEGSRASFGYVDVQPCKVSFAAGE